jgi:hypothetical protein
MMNDLVDQLNANELAIKLAGIVTNNLDDTVLESVEVEFDVDELRCIVSALQAQASLLTDSARIDWLEKQARASRTGVSLDHVPWEDGTPAGYRYMHYHYISEQHSSIRRAIDFAMKIHP